ncbi:Carnitine O-palmitoyltransferase 1, liver isoform [Portunus trituberculatus]|uniref:Carnitine O-palmitoyltransferase 1, liver isoform n=1 Tax=Portunus trituberculatus TaxID=210409 RepID=A0A5B7CMV4_PORTR|nr:Carnitine O-palmitoyltransferase 1, liver isoform [Portunus trituberculatus]
MFIGSCQTELRVCQCLSGSALPGELSGPRDVFTGSYQAGLKVRKDENVREVSWKNKLWGLTVKFVSGYQPSLYSCQRSLPRMPVPAIDETLSKLLDSLKPLCSEEEFKDYSKQAQDFECSIGPRLQRLLYLKSWWAPNYVSDWWEKYVYLMSRCPLVINSNYYALDHYIWTPTSRQVSGHTSHLQLVSPHRNFHMHTLFTLLISSTLWWKGIVSWNQPTTPQQLKQITYLYSKALQDALALPNKTIPDLYCVSRAANVVHSILSIKRQIDREELQPLLLRNTIPICMAQYERLFSTVRVPGEEIDELLHFDSQESRHIVVWRQGLFYQLGIYDDKNQLLSVTVLEKLFQDIIDDADKHKDSMQTNPSHNYHGICVTVPVFLQVVLSDKVPENLSEKGKMLLHSDGRTLWCDKSVNVFFFPDGQCGLNVEHSMADAPVMGHVWEYAMTMEVIERRYLDSGQVMPPPKSFKPGNVTHPRRIIWDITDSLEKQINKAYAFNQKNNDDLDLVIREHTKFGKGVIKKAKISPDAFIQISLQLAYYRHTGRFCQTYEASATRLYQNGRTETVRSCTEESSAFVRAMVSSKMSKEELLQLLRVAGIRHQKLYRDAMNGLGIDRHLFALFVVSKGLGYESQFLESVMRRPWTLSTSQQPQQQIQANTPDINLEPFRKMPLLT